MITCGFKGVRMQGCHLHTGQSEGPGAQCRVQCESVSEIQKVHIGRLKGLLEA